MKNAISILEKRGFTHQFTNKESLTQIMLDQHIKVYIGFDCTAKSLHVGSLIQIMKLRFLQKLGHQPIVLLGSGTTKIGDPTGKDKARIVLQNNEIEENKKSILKVFYKYLDFQSDNKAIVLDNENWLSEINYMEFLRDFGKYFSINNMLSFDSVKLRLSREQSLSFLEFNYMLLQAYDFYHIFQKENCILQMGGSDQWGNIINGVELIKKKLGKEVFGLTSPLLTMNSGNKMGKSEKGAVWLNEDMYSSYDFWQFWRNTEDLDVVKFLKLFTELSIEEINELSKLEGKDLNKAKIILANEVTKLCHGEENAKKAEEVAKDTFEKKSISNFLPEYILSNEKISSEIDLPQLLLDISLCPSKSSAKKLILGNGARINNKVISDIHYIISEHDFIDKKLLVSSGKKKHMLVRIK